MFMMNKEHNANYEDRIQFIIALMTKDYTKVRDIGNRLLKHNRNDADVISALSILKRKSQREVGECERSNSIDSPIESGSEYECEGSDAIDGDDNDFVNDSTDIRIDPRMKSKIASCDASQLNNDRGKINLDCKQKMHRVLSIKIDRRVA